MELILAHPLNYKWVLGAYMQFKALQVFTMITLAASVSMAKGEACKALWSEHQAQYNAYLKNAEPEMLTKALERLDKSITGHEEWLKAFNSKLESDVDIRTNIIGIKERTSQLRKIFDAFTDKDKAILFSSQNRFEHFKEARDADELFEESLTQEYFGVRSSTSKEAEPVYKYISIVEEMNWSLVQPLYKMLKAKAKSEKGDKTWYDANGIELEAKVNHYRHTGEYVVSLCSRLDEEKEFKFLSDYEALPPQFACTRLNLKDGIIEKGMENREETASPEIFQAFLSESYFIEHDIQGDCLGFFKDKIGGGSKKKVASKAGKSKKVALN